LEIILAIPHITPHQRITIADVVTQADRAVQMIADVRTRMLAPQQVKAAPVFSMTQVAALCGLDKGQFAYRLGPC
jgi:chromosome partitioning protein